jgi:hypothetical protein
VIISAFSLLISLTKDRSLKRKQYSDEIRNAASVTNAKLSRWPQISQSLFDELQLDITEADIKLVDTGDVIKTRDMFWKAVNERYAKVLDRIMDEEIEIAYSSLYGYDPNIYILFSQAVIRLRKLNELTLETVLSNTQYVIMKMEKELGLDKYHSAQLGNELRFECSNIRMALSEQSDRILEAFRNQIQHIVSASDVDIEKKKIDLGDAKDIFPSIEEMESAYRPSPKKITQPTG